MKIGMIVAIQEEIDALFRACGTPLGTEQTAGYTVWVYRVAEHTVYVTGSGVGEIASSAAAQYLITKYGVELLVNYGVCGGLTAGMGLQSTVFVKSVVHYDYDISAYIGCPPCQYDGLADIYIPADEQLLAVAARVAPEIPQVICASADKFVAGLEAKSALHERFGAEICEMESAGILLTARRNSVPALFVKGVSDSVTGGAEEFAAMVHSSANVCLQVPLKLLECFG